MFSGWELRQKAAEGYKRQRMNNFEKMSMVSQFYVKCVKHIKKQEYFLNHKITVRGQKKTNKQLNLGQIFTILLKLSE